MYAIIHTGGKQFKVSEGDSLSIQKLEGVKGDKVLFDKVLMVGEGESLKVGAPFLDQATVEAEILRFGRAKKILVFKKKRRKGYAKKQGHRQDFTQIKILKIQA